MAGARPASMRSLNGERRFFAARRVILAGGTLASPVLLQRSGRAWLAARAARTPAIADRAEVGENLKEHCALAMQWRVRPGLSTNAEFGGWRLIRNVIRDHLARTGPMASAAYDVLGHIRTRPDLPRPDAQLIAAPFSIDKSAATLKMEDAPGCRSRSTRCARARRERPHHRGRPRGSAVPPRSTSSPMRRTGAR
ncbi:GMC family oxidoreductase N-terminal domain-containing protein [Sphingomonas sp. MMS24-JH45]